MKLTTNNYYSEKANQNYMSVSQYKEFQKCEACAMAQLKGEYEKPKTSALFLGSFVDEMLTGTLKTQTKFIVEHRTDIFQRGSKLNKCTDEELTTLLNDYSFKIFTDENKLYAEIVQALETVERVKKQSLMMQHLSGKQQKIMTGEIAGVPFKIKMDSYHPDKMIVDLKYMASLRSPNMFEPMVKYWGYDIQGAVYQEIVYQNTGKRLPFYLNIATKEKPAHLAVAEIKQYDLDEALENVIKNAPRYQAIKNREIEPERCEDYNCDYCTETAIITEPTDSNFLGLPQK